MKKAILLLFLMLALLFGNRTTSSAQTATIPLGSGTIGDPYLIASLENLYWIANQANNKSNNFSGKYFIQTADIDASSTSTWFSGAGWTPISGTSTDFFGSYNGQGHIISGLHINRSSTGCVGLFGTLGKGTIQNLGLTNVSITGHANVGGLIGYLWNTATVSNCYTTGSVTATDQCCGGLIGKDDGAGGTDNNTVSQCYSGCTVSGTDYTGGLIGQAFSATTTFGTITDCYATGAVTTSDVNTGGLIGWIGAIGSVSNCYATGAVTSSGASATGGLIGSSESKSGTVNNCYATGNVTATLITSFEVGGLIGVASSTGTVSNCYATGTVTAGTTFVNGSLDFSSSIGGLIGKNSSAVSRCFATGATYGGNYVGGLLGLNSGVVSDCYSTGTITDNGYNGHLGGLIGQNQNTVSKCYSISYFISLSSAHGGLVGDNATGGVINNNCFWNTDINTNGVQYVSGGTSVAVGKTTAEMQIQSTFTGWDFTTIWARTDTKNNKYPYLAWQTGYLPTLATTVGSATSTTSINLGGNITNNGNATVTERGIVYSSSNAKPIIGGTGVTKTIIGSGSGSFSTTVGSLIGGTTYYVKSYAINSMGTSYGDEVSFSTTYHITYNLNGGTNNVANTATYTYGVGLTLINPTQTGYTFGGWYDNTG
ncbi:MAG: filamentous hemagglutinin N-terminal protein, partial [Bacteroidetes bacterium]|nr:filamentous hemagglutinin N-terminal protein [Bacteroidota bacterium]